MEQGREESARDLMIRVATEVKGMRREMSERFDKVDRRLEKGDDDLEEHGKDIVRIDGDHKSTKRELGEHKDNHNRRDGILISAVGIIVGVILAVAKLVGGI